MQGSVSEGSFVRHSSDSACRVAEMVIEDLASENIGLRDRVQSLMTDVVQYRALAVEALVEVGRQGREIYRLRGRNVGLLEELRGRRERIAA